MLTSSTSLIMLTFGFDFPTFLTCKLSSLLPEFLQKLFSIQQKKKKKSKKLSCQLIPSSFQCHLCLFKHFSPVSNLLHHPLLQNGFRLSHFSLVDPVNITKSTLPWLKMGVQMTAYLAIGYLQQRSFKFFIHC